MLATRVRGIRGAMRWDRGEGGGGHQGRVILAPRHVTPVVDRLLGRTTKARSRVMKPRPPQSKHASSLRAARTTLRCSILSRQLPPSVHETLTYRYPFAATSHVACEIILEEISLRIIEGGRRENLSGDL